MIEIVAGPHIADGEGGLLAVPVFADRTWGPGAEWAAGELGEWVEGHFDSVDFTGKSGQVAVVPGGSLAYSQVAFVGLGDEVDSEGLRQAAGTLAKLATMVESVATTLHQVDIDDAAEAVASGFLLGQYRFDKYRSEPKPSAVERFVLLDAGDVELEAARHGSIVARGVTLARDLVNEPPVSKPPVEMARIAADLAEGVRVEVFDEERIAEERLGGLMGVAAGATNPARLVQFWYEPEQPKAFLALVGKGIVFDSGGLSLKTPAGMETMKTDMSGAAAVYGAVQAIAELGLPVRVLGITPLTENMPGGSAQRPGDVLTARNGKTIEVLNTDAEGRLVLADGLALAAEQEPDLIIDVATLTGACMVALGPKIGGLFSNDDESAELVLAAGKRAGERLWRMPLPDDYRKHIDSDVADMKNTGIRWGGAINAAMLLKEFVADRPWVHLDIAGPARASDAEHYVVKGGTGFGVRTLVAVAEALAAG